MKHGKYNFGYRLRALSTRTLFCACLVACLIAGGCRSSRNLVQETDTIEHIEFNSSEGNESIHSEATDSICQRDSIKGSAVERGRIDIERDSAGLPVVIVWNVQTDFSAEASTEKIETGLFDLRRKSNNAEASGSEDSVTKKKEEITKEVNVGIPLECLIGWSIVALLILFYTGNYIYRIWKRKRKE